MSREKAQVPAAAALPAITRHDRARYVREARRLRAAQFDQIFAAIGRALARIVPGTRRARRPATPAAAGSARELPWGAKPL